MAFLVVLAGFLLSGCFGGNPSRPVEPKSSPKETGASLESIHTEAGEYTRKAGSQEKRWYVKWKSAELKYDEDKGRAYGTMDTVSGTIYRDGKAVSDFSGKRAISQKESSILSLVGDIEVVSRDETKATLFCDDLEWHGDQDLLIAKGNVHVKAQGYEVGSVPVLFSNGKLNEVATPKLYARDNMEVRKKLAATITAMAALAVGQQTSFKLQGKDGSFEIKNWKNINSKLVDSAKGIISVHAEGNPVVGVMDAQKMTANADVIDARGVRSGRTYLLEKATLTGSVHIEANRPGKTAGSEQTIILDTPSAVYTRDLEKVVFEGKVTVDQSDPSAKQSFKLTGTSGSLTLYPPGEAPSAKRAIRAMQLSGPVTFTLKSQRLVEEGTPPVKKMVPFTINGRGRELTYDDSTRKLVLNVDVHIEGDDPLFPITSTARKVTITLDEDWNPVEVQGEGEPGRTEARQRPPKRK